MAQRGLPHTAPNPAVGALLLKNGKVVAEGWHAKFGQPHAEVAVLEDAKNKGVNPAECVLVVTLEPCNHHGKTPPCSHAIVLAGIKYVVIGTSDPTSKAAGGADFLRQNGVKVELGVCEDECKVLIADFVFWQNSKLPYVSLKMASTLDGFIATRAGKSRWITGPEARSRVHALRAHSQAVMIGGTTFRNDNPLLTVRNSNLLGNSSGDFLGNSLGDSRNEFLCDFSGNSWGECSGNILAHPSHCQENNWLYLEPPHNFEQPLALVVSGQIPNLELKPHLLTQRPEKVIFICVETSPLAKNKSCVEDLGCQVMVLPVASPNFEGAGQKPLHEQAGEPGYALSKNQLKIALQELRSKHNCWRILCEGGGQLALSLLKYNFIQEFELHLAPCIMGDSKAKKIFEGLMPLEINETLPLELLRTGVLGKDIIMQFKPAFKSKMACS